MAQQMMQRFIDIDAEMPNKRDAVKRKQDFDEIYQSYAIETAEDQAGRCSQCGVPFCQTGCPLGNNIPDWLYMRAQGRMKEAYELSSATNILPEICGRICPQDRLCEGVCVIEQSGHGAVTIGAIEKDITDTAFANGWVEPIIPAVERPESIAIIGAGPGGLAAAARLRMNGFQVTIYDRYDRAGGLLIYGIPGFKLEKDIVTRRSDWLLDSGVDLKLNQDIGKTIAFKTIMEQHHATIIATGVYQAREIKAPGSGLQGIHKAMDFLTASNRVGLGDKVDAYDQGVLNAQGKHVVVIGGGDTAMDCVRTAIRQGAASVKCLYRRNKENMPGSAREVKHAEEEGVEFLWLSAPEAFTGDDHVTGVKMTKMRLGDPDASGRRAPQKIDGKGETLKADMVITALGFDPEDLPLLWDEPKLPITKWGTLIAEPISGKTSMEKTYAIGDIVRGASLVVWAVKDGQDCADAIMAELKEKTQTATAA